MVNKNRICLNNILHILQRLFLILMLAQILSGIVWLIKNMGHLSQFHETYIYTKAAENLVLDEYMGILYPLLIALAKGIEEIIPLPYYTFLYFVQVVCASFSGFYFLYRMKWIKQKGKKGKILAVLATLYLLTFPLLLQLHLAVLPYSLAMSAAVLLIGEGLFYLRNGELVSGSVLIKLCGLWLLTYLLLPDCGLLMGVFVCGIFLGIPGQNKRWRLRLLMALVSTALCFGVISGSTQTPGSMGRMQKTTGAAMVSRFVWPHFVNYSFYWDERINETFEYLDLLRFAQSPEAVMYEFGPILEEKYGKEEADSIYRDMAVTSLRLGTRQALAGAGRDFLSFLCPQAAVQEQLRDNDSSLSGWNYGRMQDNAPVATKYYMNIALTGWNVMCLLGMIRLLIEKILRAGSGCRSDRVSGSLPHRWHMPQAGPVLLLMLAMAAWYTMCGGMQDYKKAMVTTFIWTLFVVKSFFKMEDERN